VPPQTDGDARDIDRIASTDTAVDGDDVIITGRGNDIVLGDSGQLTAAHFDDPATPFAAHPFTVCDIQTIGFADGGADRITGTDGNDVIFGGTGGDTIHAGAGNDLVFDDQGEVECVNGKSFDPANLPPVCTDLGGTIAFTAIDVTAPADGGNDLIYGEDGDDVILGQQGSDTIYGGAGDDDLIGGQNVSGGLDAGDRIDGGTGNDVIAGDNAEICRTAPCG
jgi:Ca2+-binding RTX toxin-like protein